MNLILKLILVIQTIKNYPQAIFDRLGLIDGEILYHLKNGTSFYARAGTEDLSEIAVVASGSEYDFSRVKISKKPVMVDLGGHIGSFCIPIAERYNDNCKIFVFEADDKNFDLLMKNVQLNERNSIKAENVAISGFNGKGFLKTKNLNTDAYHLLQKSKITNCNVKTLPSALNKYKLKKIDILKMDIEGAEDDIFRHKLSNNFIKNKVKIIFIEVDHNFENSNMRKIIEKNFIFIAKHNNVITYSNKNS